jgi:hypothetical protein
MDKFIAALDCQDILWNSHNSLPCSQEPPPLHWALFSVVHIQRASKFPVVLVFILVVSFPLRLDLPSFLFPLRYSVRGSSVGIATGYGLDDPGIESQWGEIFRPSRPALGLTQPPVQWVPCPSRGVKYGRGVLLTTHTLLVPRSWKSRAIFVPTLWATIGPVTGTYLRYSDENFVCIFNLFNPYHNSHPFHNF